MAAIQKRVSKAGKVSYRVQVRIKGYPAEQATFERLTDAKRWAQQVEAAMREQRHFKTAVSKRHTVADMIDRYLGQVEQERPKYFKNNKPMLEWWKGEIGTCVLSDLSKAVITEAIDKLSARQRTLKDGTIKAISPARVNRYISSFSRVCSLAYRDWEWLPAHPMEKITRKAESKGRVRYLDDNERIALLDACKAARSSYLYLIVILALSTGARRGEIINLKWKDIDLDRRVIYLHDTKNKESRVLPLVSHALELMREHSKVRRIDSELVFPSKKDPKKPWGMQKAWELALRKSGVKDFRFHDLRHSAASYLAMNGATLAEIAEVLGHKTLQMVKRYAHLSEAHTSSVVASMNEKVFGDG